VIALDALNRPALEARLETICQKGCRLVWDDIARLERGESLPETHALTDDERRWLLDELRTIMAVYSGRCSVD
jgi:hypothetical protein